MVPVYTNIPISFPSSCVGLEEDWDLTEHGTDTVPTLDSSHCDKVPKGMGSPTWIDEYFLLQCRHQNSHPLCLQPEFLSESFHSEILSRKSCLRFELEKDNEPDKSVFKNIVCFIFPAIQCINQYIYHHKI